MIILDNNSEAELKHHLIDIRLNNFLPKLIISIYDGNLIFTTKKIASRFFTDLSKKSDESTPCTLELSLLRNIEGDNLYDGYRYSEKLNLYYTESSQTYLSIDEFNSILKIQNFDQIFSMDIIEKWNYLIISKDPFERLVTALIEKSDSELTTICENRIVRTLIADKYKILPSSNYSFKKIDKYIIKDFLDDNFEDILLYNSHDEHITYWNSFMEKFIKQLEIPKFEFIVLGKSKNPIFENTNNSGSGERGVSNSEIYNLFLNEGHRAIEKLIKLSRPYLVHEYDSFENLLKYNKK